MLTQEAIGIHLGMDQSSVSRMCAELNIDWRKSTMDEVRLAYIQRLREQAAGRIGMGATDLVTERALLARAQKERIEMQNAVTRGELAPTILLEQVLAATAARVAGVFDSIPGAIRRRIPDLPLDAAILISGEIAKVRNMVATMTIQDVLVGEGIPSNGEGVTG